MATTLYDDVIGIDETVEIEHDIARNAYFGDEAAYFVNGGEEGVDIDLEWWVQPEGSTQWFRAENEDYNNADLADGLVLHPTLAGAGSVRIAVSNNHNEPVTLKLVVQSYRT